MAQKSNILIIGWTGYIGKYIVEESAKAGHLALALMRENTASNPEQVYIYSSNVDDYLVESITGPAADPNAGEVYYRLMTRFMLNQSKFTLDGVLSELSCPLLLLWGDLDPWVGPAKANRIKEFYPKTSLVNLKAGHCTHDEVPELANKALLDWLSGLTLEASPPVLVTLFKSNRIKTHISLKVLLVK